MILNSRQSSFVVHFPSTFFSGKIKEKYQKYFDSLILPFRNIDDFMSSTIQSIDFPSLDMKPVTQTRQYGKQQDYKNSTPIIDLFNREFSINFKLTDAYLNYFIFVDNALNYLNFENVENNSTGNSLSTIKSKPIIIGTGQYLDPIRLSLLSNEGHIILSIVFNKPIITGWSDLKLNYSSNAPEFNTFNVKFRFFDMQILPDFN